jgi:Flp pilus assembly protein TadD
VEGHFNLSTALGALGHQAEARRAMQRFEELSDHAAQIAQLRLTLDSAPEDVNTRLALAHHYQQLGQSEPALLHYHAILAVSPDQLETLIKLGNLYLKKNQKHEADSLFSLAITHHPADPQTAQAHFALGYMRLNAGQLETAETAFRQALALQPAYTEAWNNLGNLHILQGDQATAEGDFRRALQVAPQSAEAHYNLGGLYLRQGKLPEAEDQYLQALRADAAYSKVLFALGALYEQRGQQAEARRAYTVFLEGWQGDPSLAKAARQRLDILR